MSWSASECKKWPKMWASRIDWPLVRQCVAVVAVTIYGSALGWLS